MAEFKVARRDLIFQLFEQFEIDKLGEVIPRYEGMGREEYQLILDQNLKLMKEVISLCREKADAIGCQLQDGKTIVPEVYYDAYKQYAEGGWVAPGRDDEYGGMNLPHTLALTLTGMGSLADPSFMFYPGLTVAAGHLIENFANPKVKKLFVKKMYTGQWTGTMCLTEPQAGTAVGDLLSRADPIEGEDTYKVTGNKIFISAGDHELTENIVHLVLARVPGDPNGIKGISLFAVPKRRINANGEIIGDNFVVTQAIEHKMGINGCSTCSLAFGEGGDSVGYLIGERCKGIVAMFQMMNEARIACGLQGAAAAMGSYLQALEYAKEREQGTKVTDRSTDAKSVCIIEHPDVRRNLMISKAWSEGVWALLLQTSLYAEYADHHPDESVREHNKDLMNLLTPICKALSTDKGFKVTELAIQVFGGYGYIREYGIEQYMRDVKIASIYEGTNGIQALDLLGRKMRQKSGQLFMRWVQDTTMFLEKNKEHLRLAEQVKALDKAKNTLGEVAFSFTAQGKKDPELAILGATPFLEMFGHVEVGSLLLKQAIIADRALEVIFDENQSLDPESQTQLCQKHSDAKFYDGKIKTMKFFISSILPQIYALSREIKDNDRSALDIIF